MATLTNGPETMSAVPHSMHCHTLLATWQTCGGLNLSVTRLIGLDPCTLQTCASCGISNQILRLQGASARLLSSLDKGLPQNALRD